MLRLELEIAMLEGTIQSKDLPEAWNARMEDYLGITPPTDSDGVLQDIHWAHGIMGYFPTYALGNLVAAQLWERITNEIPDLDDHFRQGDFSALLEWLREHVHQHGSKYQPQDLIQRVTGTKIDPEPYVRYLNSKFSQIYGF
jgi:carboxypeptidase Taq